MMFFKSIKWRKIKSYLIFASFLILLFITIKADIENIAGVPNFGYFLLGVLVTYIPNALQNLKDDESWKVSQRQLERGKLINNDTMIRISFAYLFRIKVNNKYMLVPNSRTGKFQPVGGAYKFDDIEKKYLSDNFSAENDDCIPVDMTTKNDYRLNIKNKYLRQFVERFNVTNNRENISNLSREFEEELIKSNILNHEVFNEIKYRYIGRHMTEIIRTSFKPFELLLADIVELDLTKQQEEYLSKLMQEESDAYIFASCDQIKAEGMILGSDVLHDNIANHSYKILTENTDNLISSNHKQEFIVTI